MRRAPVALATAALAVTLLATECESTRQEAARQEMPAREVVREAAPAPAMDGAAPVAQGPGAPAQPLPSGGGDASPPTTLESGELARLAASMVVPVSGVPRSGIRDSYTEARGERTHEALDILAARGTPVVSASDGRLLRMFDSRAGGLMVYATDPSERFIFLYGHLDRYAEGLRDGMPLVRGQRLGYVGTTGNAAPDTPHLHFGVLVGDPAVSWSSGVAVNPYPLLARHP